MSKAFDFSAVNLRKLTDDAQEMEVVHPETQEGLGVFLAVRGFESETFKQMARKEANAERKRRFEAERKGKAASVRLLEDDEVVNLRMTSALVEGWRTVVDGKSEPVIYVSGAKLEFNADNLDAWLREYDWVIPQIDKFAGDVANFTKGSSGSLPTSPPVTSS